ncbi:hypothetical protein WG66_003927 [Moniliophthora roreri]|nr:hypothetical protein WG66_003927 [Moniliophthora roreri]
MCRELGQTPTEFHCRDESVVYFAFASEISIRQKRDVPRSIFPFLFLHDITPHARTEPMSIFLQSGVIQLDVSVLHISLNYTPSLRTESFNSCGHFHSFNDTRICIEYEDQKTVILSRQNATCWSLDDGQINDNCAHLRPNYKFFGSSRGAAGDVVDLDGPVLDAQKRSFEGRGVPDLVSNGLTDDLLGRDGLPGGLLGGDLLGRGLDGQSV